MEKICGECGNTFEVKPSKFDRYKFCSRACRAANETRNGRAASRKDEIKFSCKVCSTEFGMKPSYLTAYRKMHHHDPLFCSSKCFGANKASEADARNFFTCVQCGTVQNKRRKPGGRIYHQQKLCSHECKVAWQMNEAKRRFESGEVGRHVKRHGYVWLSIPALASKTGKKMAMLEHRYVMEQILGRELLPEETVHHKNGNRAENTPENLELFSSRHGPGQRVEDKIAFAIDMIKTYPDFARKQGYVLTKIDS